MTVRQTKMSLGNPLRGTPINETKFVGVSSLNQLESFGLSRPSVLEHALVRDMKKDHKLACGVTLRREIQRRMDKPRMVRARFYARYMEDVEINGRAGGTPPITLWVGHAEVGECGDLIIPYGEPIIAIDGETQTEGRFMMRDDDEFSSENTGDLEIAVTIYHDVSEEFARQILHDANRYAHPVSEKQLAAQNSEGPLTKATLAVIEKAKIPLEKVNRYRGTPNAKQIVAQSQIMYSVIGYTLKDAAIEKEVSPTMLNMMNNATIGAAINGDTVERLGLMAETATQSMDARKSGAQVWKVGGVLVAAGRDPSTLNWSAGLAASKAEKKFAAKLKKIHASM